MKRLLAALACLLTLSIPASAGSSPPPANASGLNVTLSNGLASSLASVVAAQPVYVSNYAALQALTYVSGAVVTVLGRTTPNDGGGATVLAGATGLGGITGVAAVNSDFYKCLYIAPASDTTGASGIYTKLINTIELPGCGGKPDSLGTTFGTDNGPILNAAVTISAATGFPIHIPGTPTAPSGTQYAWGKKTPLAVNSNYVAIYGDGPGRTLIRDYSYNDGFQCGNAASSTLINGLKLRDMTFRGNADSYATYVDGVTTPFSAALRFASCIHYTVENVDFQDYTDGRVLDGTSGNVNDADWRRTRCSQTKLTNPQTFYPRYCWYFIPGSNKPQIMSFTSSFDYGNLSNTSYPASGNYTATAGQTLWPPTVAGTSASSTPNGYIDLTAKSTNGSVYTLFRAAGIQDFWLDLQASAKSATTSASTGTFANGDTCTINPPLTTTSAGTALKLTVTAVSSGVPTAYSVTTEGYFPDLPGTLNSLATATGTSTAPCSSITSASGTALSVTVVFNVFPRAIQYQQGVDYLLYAVDDVVSGAATLPQIIPAVQSTLGNGATVPPTSTVTGARLSKFQVFMNPVLTATVSAAGSGYANKDTCTLPTVTNGSPAVLTYNGSAWSLTTPGLYPTQPSNPVACASTSGAGSGASFTLTYGTPTGRLISQAWKDPTLLAGIRMDAASGSQIGSNDNQFNGGVIGGAIYAVDDQGGPNAFNFYYAQNNGVLFNMGPLTGGSMICATGFQAGTTDFFAVINAAANNIATCQGQGQGNSVVFKNSEVAAFAATTGTLASPTTQNIVWTLTSAKTGLDKNGVAIAYQTYTPGPRRIDYSMSITIGSSTTTNPVISGFVRPQYSIDGTNWTNAGVDKGFKLAAPTGPISLQVPITGYFVDTNLLQATNGVYPFAFYRFQVGISSSDTGGTVCLNAILGNATCNAGTSTTATEQATVIIKDNYTE